MVMSRLFGGRKQCAKCCEVLQADELVMRGREHLFHTRCFSCHVCQTHLTKGSTFGMIGSLIFCQAHYRPEQVDESAHQAPPPQPDCYAPYYNHDNSYGRVHQYNGQQFYDPRSSMMQQPYDPIEAMGPNNTKMYDPQVASSPKNQRIRNKRRNSAKSEGNISSGKLKRLQLKHSSLSLLRRLQNETKIRTWQSTA